MRIPVIQGLIDRRILVNYRVAPEIMAQWLPRPFRPQLIHGQAIAGICLIRLKHVRPQFLHLPIGIGSENAAHRVAVEWDHDGQLRHGVYIPRRDTNSWLNALAGGRLFPGEHHYARFQTRETETQLSVSLDSADGDVQLSVTGSLTDKLPPSSLFKSLPEASAFFERGAVGYSVTRDPERFDGIELRCNRWQVLPLQIEQVHSSFFADRTKFPDGSVDFDCALVMRGIEHQWHSREDLCCQPTSSR